VPPEVTTRIAAATFGVAVAAAVPGAGFGMQRIMAQMALSGGTTFDATAALGLFESPTQMSLGGAVYGPMRGCVVGNVLLWLACFVGAYAAAGVVGHRSGVGMAVAAQRMALPAQLWLPFELLLEPTAASALTLIFYAQSTADVGVGLLGLAAICAWCVCCVRGYRRLNSFPAKPTETAEEGEPAVSEGASVALVLKLLRPVRFLKAVDCQWISRSVNDGTFNSYIGLFEDYGPGRQWFLGVEMASGVATAALTAYMQSPGDDTPQGRIDVGNIAVCVGVLLSCGAWAHNERLARLDYLSTAVISLVGAVLSMRGLADAAEAVLQAKLYLMICCAVVSHGESGAMIFVRAARLQLSVAAFISSRLEASVRELQKSATAEMEAQMRRIPVGTFEQLLNDGLVLPRPLLRPSEAQNNLRVLVKHVVAVHAAASVEQRQSRRGISAAQQLL
jgi:hypothetical protein